ncbi:MAG: GvpL/GvpF family gas vesicle protein [Alphaproteobacteria bacterium]
MTLNSSLYYLHAVVPARDATIGGEGLRGSGTIGAVRINDLAVLYTDLGEIGLDAAQMEAEMATADGGEALVRQHQDLMCGLRDQATALLPFPFCTLYRNLDHVAEMLRLHGAVFRVALSRIAGAAEWSVQLVREDDGPPAQDLDDEAARALRAEMEAAAPGRRFLLQQSYERTLKDHRRSRLAERISTFHRDLGAVSREAVQLAHGGVDSARRMAFKGAYLVADDSQERFLEKLDDRAGQLARDGWKTVVQGPWPAYSFISLEEDAA